MCRIYDDGKPEVPVTRIRFTGKPDFKRFLVLGLADAGKCRGPEIRQFDIASPKPETSFFNLETFSQTVSKRQPFI